MKKAILTAAVLFTTSSAMASTVVVTPEKDVQFFRIIPKTGIFVPFNGGDTSIMYGGEILKQVSPKISVGVSVMAGKINLEQTTHYTVSQQTGVTVSQSCSSKQVCTRSHCKTVEECTEEVTPVMSDITKERKTSYSTDAFVIIPTVEYALSENIALEAGVGYANIDDSGYTAFKAGATAYVPVNEHISFNGSIEYLNVDRVDGMLGSVGISYTFN